MAWNEPNNGLQPTLNDPARAGRYFYHLSDICRSQCRVIAGDFSESNEVAGEAGSRKPGAYFRAYKAAAKIMPRIWAWHAYGVGYERETVESAPAGRFARFIAGTRAQSGKVSANDPRIWVTEVGGSPAHHLQGQQNAGQPLDRPGAEARANEDLAHLLRELPRFPRVDRIYVYSWSGTVQRTIKGKTVIQFDTGLTSAYAPINPKPSTAGVCSDPKNCFASRAAYETAKSFTVTR